LSPLFRVKFGYPRVQVPQAWTPLSAQATALLRFVTA
jgi:hypothetical protein